MSMMSLAKHIIAVAQKEEIKITNLQLQKVLYFTIINGLKEGLITKMWLKKEYDEKFLVWRYGPVVETVYEHYSIFGASPIFLSESENEKYTYLNCIINTLLKEKISRLVRDSHTHSHWKNHETEINFGRSEVPYLLEDLENAARE